MAVSDKLTEINNEVITQRDLLSKLKTKMTGAASDAVTGADLKSNTKTIEDISTVFDTSYSEGTGRIEDAGAAGIEFVQASGGYIYIINVVGNTKGLIGFYLYRNATINNQPGTIQMLSLFARLRPSKRTFITALNEYGEMASKQIYPDVTIYSDHVEFRNFDRIGSYAMPGSTNWRILPIYAK